jgi:hypothetical protein
VLGGLSLSSQNHGASKNEVGGVPKKVNLFLAERYTSQLPRSNEFPSRLANPRSTP